MRPRGQVESQMSIHPAELVKPLRSASVQASVTASSSSGLPVGVAMAINGLLASGGLDAVGRTRAQPALVVPAT
jgi:hypothetical protein